MRRLYRLFAAMVRRTGPVRTHPMKTRIAFISRMSFAGISLGATRARVGLIATRRIDSPRFAKVERYGPRSFGHYLDVRTEFELDEELQGWLEEAAAVGRQEHLRGSASGRGVGGAPARALATARDRPAPGRR